METVGNRREQTGMLPPIEDSQPLRRMDEQPSHKVILAGDGGVGKSTLVRRICDGEFAALRRMTIGVDFQVKRLRVLERDIKLVLWDMGGQDRFASMRPGFYRGGRAVGLVYDLTNRASFDNLPLWLKEVGANLPQVPIVLVGNKRDLAGETGRAVSHEEAVAFALMHALPYGETSCRTGDGVDAFLNSLGRIAMLGLRTRR